MPRTTKAQKRKRARRPVEEPDLWAPIRQAKLQPDTLMLLYNRERITSEQWEAALDIREAFELVTNGTGIRIADLLAAGGKGYSEGERIRAIMVQQRYNAWVDLLTRRATASKRFIGCFAVTLDVCVEGLMLGEVERSRRLKEATAFGYLSDGLDLYIEAKKAIDRRTGLTYKRR